MYPEVDKELMAFIIGVVLIMISMMGFSTYEEIALADAGLQQCSVKTNTGYRVVWQKECQKGE